MDRADVKTTYNNMIKYYLGKLNIPHIYWLSTKKALAKN